MKAKTKTTASKQEATPALVPKLRFPEFRGAALRSVRLGDVTEEGRSRNGHKHSVTSVMGVTKADGIVPMEARLIAADIARYKLVQNDWFAYNPMRLNIGSIARWKGESEILVSPDYVVFKCITEDGSGIDPAYLDQFRRTNAWEDFVTEGGDGSVRVRIYYKDIARVGLALPSLPEQQKIAECLSSVDELMAAQARKVDALKTHKKGLMQQLFPREGETQPRLRFPEFQNAEEWESKMLGDVVKSFKTGKLDANAMVENGQYRFYTCAKNYYQIDHYAFEGEALLVAGNGAHLGYIHHYIGKFNAYQRTYVLQDFKANAVFLRCLLDRYLPARIQFEKKDGNTPYIVLSTLTEMPLVIPRDPDEQQRIATCLSSLDALITAEIQKHEALKTHKKGLMQQLFPSPEEVES